MAASICIALEIQVAVGSGTAAGMLFSAQRFLYKTCVAGGISSKGFWCKLLVSC